MNSTDRVRSRNCASCKQIFIHRIGRGLDRRHCSEECRSSYNMSRFKARHASRPKCRADGCTSRATRVKSGFCETCYYRVRRTGSTEARRVIGRCITSAGYILIKRPEHPLSNTAGYVYEHRAILYEKLGEGNHSCFWCGAILCWADIVVDHLNEIKNDNRADNLLVTCNRCNRARGAMIPFLRSLKPEAFEVFVESARQHQVVV